MRVSVGTIALGVCSAVLFTVAASCEHEYRQYPVKLAGLTPLHLAMPANESVHAQFTAIWSEPHYVALVFPKTVDTKLSALLHHAANNVGADQENTVHFDFDWRILEGAIEIARGSGRMRPISSFGSDETALAFGEFRAVAGHVYQLEARPGPSFEKWAATQPSLEVGVHSPGPSLGLPWVKEFNRPIAIVLASLGLLFLGGAWWTSKK